MKDLSLSNEALILYIKQNNLEILFDTSDSRENFFKSLKKNNIDLKKINCIILSHEHFDHSYGLLGLKKEDLSPKTKIIINKKIYEDLIEKKPKKTAVLKTLNIIKPQEDFYITPEIIYTNSLEGEGYNKFKKIMVPVVESFLIIKKNNKLTIITGCAHPGIIKMIKYAKNLTKCQNIKAILGGMDIIDCEKTKYLDDTNADIYPIHCSFFKKCKAKKIKNLPLIL